MKTNEIRDRFLRFFKDREHVLVESDSLMPENDPSLLFTGAGMNQFKDYFLGLRKDLKRAVSSQKCLRTGDLDEVGRTAYHHSFFEMLGNFSFGDYFKEEAITWAWEFLTQEMRLPRERLRVSVNQSDEEAYRIWRDSIEVPEKWIAQMGDKTNFWPSNARQEGPNGPCGPCSEIYYDQGEQAGGPQHPCSIDHDCGRFAEIWNLVFTQYERIEGGELVPLQNRNIDTGMGLERLACVVQGKKTNFEIDIFEPLVEAVSQLLGCERSIHTHSRIYAIADHIRAVTFSIGDRVIPGNEGRGYVIRKLIRRAAWHAYQLMPGNRLEEPLLYQLVAKITDLMKSAYPELVPARRNCEDTLRGEEERFLKTLAIGLSLLGGKIEQVEKRGAKILSGEEVFLLYDTYGFPDELTSQIVKERGLGIDQEGFDHLMEEQRKRAKGASAMGDTIFVTTDFEKKVHALSATKFLGYDARQARAKVLLTQLAEGKGIAVLDQTPFYAESGGQVGDQGTLEGPGLEVIVEDTRKKDGHYLHYVRIRKGQIREGQQVEAKVDSKRREATMRNHTATHLLHAVLREVLGSHVRQLGSLVHPERLRFDYSFSRPLTETELLKVEARVNEETLKNVTLEKEVKELKQAKAEGAIAFFGDKYEKKVRVVTVPGISKELCGGTHCDRTGEIGVFVIVSETSIASGVRRLEALTGDGALRYVQGLRADLQGAADRLKTTPQEVIGRIAQLQEKLKKHEKDDRERIGSEIDVKAALESAESVGRYRLIAETLEGTEREELRKASDRLRSEAKESVWILASSQRGKVHYLIGLTADLKTTALDAREAAKRVSPLIGGCGGGRKDLVEGGGPSMGLLQKNWPGIIDVVKNYLVEKG